MSSSSRKRQKQEETTLTICDHLPDELLCRILVIAAPFACVKPLRLVCKKFQSLIDSKDFLLSRSELFPYNTLNVAAMEAIDAKEVDVSKILTDSSNKLTIRSKYTHFSWTSVAFSPPLLKGCSQTESTTSSTEGDQPEPEPQPEPGPEPEQRPRRPAEMEPEPAAESCHEQIGCFWKVTVNSIAPPLNCPGRNNTWFYLGSGRNFDIRDYMFFSDSKENNLFGWYDDGLPYHERRDNDRHEDVANGNDDPRAVPPMRVGDCFYFGLNSNGGVLSMYNVRNKRKASTPLKGCKEYIESGGEIYLNLRFDHRPGTSLTLEPLSICNKYNEEIRQILTADDV